MGSVQNNRSPNKLIHLDRPYLCVFVVAAFAALISKVDSVILDEDGYYDIVIAISEKTAQDANDEYLDNLKSGIQDLGDALFESTDKKFSIRSADIVVPRHWEYVEEDGYTTTQSFHNADIRISHEYLVPQAINPLFCSYPGQHIELPSSFFDVRDTGPYGPTGKALLPLWARFRWGIHDEHGFPDDPQFPYYWKAMRLPNDPDTVVDGWRVTNCANAKIKGVYKNSETEPCGPDLEEGFEGSGDEDLYPPPSDCRFFPDVNGQEATTSLMSFPFIQSLLHFCDDDSHDKRAPTRQNHFCRYKSAWEIIRKSPDWSTLKEGSETSRARIKFRVLKQTLRPLLYILTEGVNKPPEEVISGVATGLTEIFNQTYNWNVPAGVGVFPGLDWKDSFDPLYPWNFPWYDKASQMVSSFVSAFESRSGFRNFGAAIQDLGNHIKEKHAPGAVILFLKYGSEVGDEEQSFFQTSEGEVLATILEQNIQVFVLEGADTQAQSSYRLETLAEATGGAHFGIVEDNPTENIAGVAEVMGAIDEAIKSGTPVRNYRVVHKEVMQDSGSVRPHAIQVNLANVKGIKFYLHQLVADYYDPSPIPEFTKGPLEDLPVFQQRLDWGKEETTWNHRSFEASFAEILNEPSYWEYSIPYHLCPNCHFLMIAIAELDSSIPTVSEQDISISVSTSAEADKFVTNLNRESVTTLKGTAFSIYAKLEKNGHPINSPDLEVKAHIQLFLRDKSDIEVSGGFAVVIDLLDNGQGTPDMTANDGIFSAEYIPPTPLEFATGEGRGVYQIFVTAQLKHTSEGPQKSMQTSFSPEYQLVTRCGSGWRGCWSEIIHEPFNMVYADLKRRIEFTEIEQIMEDRWEAVSRIIDLRVEQIEANRYKLVWTQPYVQKTIKTGSSGKYQAQEYKIYYTENFYHITDENEHLIEILGTHIPGNPGTPVELEIPGTIEPGKKYYFVMNTWGMDKVNPAGQPVWSNVAFLHAADPYITPTTTTSTSPSPPTSPTTTTRPTRPPQTTTIPSLTSTAASTTKSTTRATRPTTTVTTQSTTIIPSTTTVIYEPTTQSPKHWYQSTEAIVTFSVFSVLFLSLVGGGLVYFKFFKG